MKEGRYKGIDQHLDFRFGSKNRKQFGVFHLHELNDMRQRAVFSILILFQKPDHCGQKVDRRLHKEVTLFLDPFPV